MKTAIIFTTIGCGKCKTLGRKVSAASVEYAVTYVNGDDYPETAAEYGITHYPTTVFFINDRVELIEPSMILAYKKLTNS